MKNAVTIFTIVTLILFLVYCNNRSRNESNILAFFKDIKYDTAILGFIQESNRNNEIYDTVIIREGKLEYNFVVAELHEGTIIPFSLMHRNREGHLRPLPSSRIRFFLDSGDKVMLKVETKDSCVVYTASGNKLSEQIAQERGEKINIFKDGIKLFRIYNAQPINKQSDMEYWKEKSKNDSLYYVHSVDFIDRHPDYAYSARLWLEITKDQDVALRLYNKLDASVKNSFFGKLCTNVVNSWALSVEGVELPNFVATTINNEAFELKAFRGKFVVLDFWGTWCAPCITEIPKLKLVHAKWKNNLEIVGLICNDNRTSVEKAVKKYSIEWIQLFSDNNEFPFIFGIKEYPTKVLIDPEGKVIKFYDSTSDASMFDEIDSLIQSKGF